MEAVDSRQVAVRDLVEADLPAVMDYWYRSPPGFIEGLGVDMSKMPPEPEYLQRLTDRIRENSSRAESQSNALAITYAGTIIGQHSVNELKPGDSAIFHAHIFATNFRRRGVGLISYPLACSVFMKRFKLQRILFKTPLQNIGSIRVKQKMDIREIGEEVVSFGIVKEGTRARVFELLPEELDVLLRKIGRL